MRFEDDNLYVFKPAQRCLNPRTHITPIESAEAAAERRERNRSDPSSPYFIRERLETCLYVLHAAFAAPVPLGRKVDDIFRVRDVAGLEHKHPAGLDLPPLAGGFVGFEVLRVGILELERDATTHDADAIDCVDERFRVRQQDIAGPVLDHGHPLNNTSRA